MIRRLLAATLTALLLPGIALLAPPAHAAAGESAAGYGSTLHSVFCGFQETTFRFTAIGTGSANGATGNFTLTCQGLNGAGTVTGSISCLNVGGPSGRADMMGQVTSSTNEAAYSVGTEVLLSAYDELQGKDYFGVERDQTDCSPRGYFSGNYEVISGEIILQGAPTGDSDGDGVDDGIDNCPSVPNPGQADTDTDGAGDACDSTPNGDTDSDGVDNSTDNCPSVANPGQGDADGDGAGDVCDASPIGDVDSDRDGVVDRIDNCPSVSNAGQADTDGDGRGDFCEPVHARSLSLRTTHVTGSRGTRLRLSGHLRVADEASKCVQQRRVILAR